MLLLLLHKKEEEIVSAAVAEWNRAMQTLDTVYRCCCGSRVPEQYQYYESDTRNAYPSDM